MVASHPGGGAGVYDIYVASGADTFSTDSEGEETDTTDHAFSLVILSSGAEPTDPSTPNFRKIGEIDWDGSEITGFRQTFGPHSTGHTVYAVSPNPNITPLYTKGAASQASPLARLDSSAGVEQFSVSAAGVVNARTGYNVNGTALAASHLSNGTTGTGGSSVVLSVSPALTGNPTAPTQSAGDNSTKIATTAYTDTAANAAAAVAIASSSLVHIAGTETITGAKTFSAAGQAVTVNNSMGIGRLGVGAFGAVSPAVILTTASATSDIPLVARGAASQVANLQEWQATLGVVVASMSPAGNLVTQSGNAAQVKLGAFGPSSEAAVVFGSAADSSVYRSGSAALRTNSAWTMDLTLTVTGDTTFGGLLRAVAANKAYMQMNADTGGMMIATNGSANKGVVVRGAASQAANLQEWQTSTPTTVASISATGAMTAASYSTPGAVLASSNIAAQSGNAQLSKIGGYGPGGEAALALGSAADASIYRTGAAALRTNSALSVDGTLTASSAVTLADAVHITLGTGTGTKIGTATTQKIGFFNKAPVAQQATPTTLNEVITALQNLGLVA